MKAHLVAERPDGQYVEPDTYTGASNGEKCTAEA
jgi:hypothetical protein